MTILEGFFFVKVLDTVLEAKSPPLLMPLEMKLKEHVNFNCRIPQLRLLKVAKIEKTLV